VNQPISRRGFVAGLSATAAAAQSAAPRPNIVFVLSDDHSYPYLGCYGTNIRTPNLDRFAKEGMRFDNMYTAAPQCVPSRAAYMTGRSPVAVRMGRFSSPLPPDIKTLPEHLRAGGYFTGVCRRNFHLDGPGNPGPVTKRIFDEHEMRTWDGRVDFLNRNAPRAQTVPIVNQFLDKVPQRKPFFLWLNFNDPHHPWDANAIPDPHKPDRLLVPAHLPDLPGMRADLGRYYDEISRADEEFASILQVLEKRGLAKNTIVVFAGDNGMAFPHGKGSLYDPGLHVPMLIRWPGLVKPGSIVKELVSGEDVAPTLLEAAGIERTREMSGRSFLRLLKGESYEHRKYIFGARLPHGNSRFMETTKSSTFDLSRCVRSKRWKLIYNCTPQMEYQPVDSARDPGWTETVAANRAGTLAAPLVKAYFTRPRPVIELYDLESDPSELSNLAGRPEHAAIEQEMKEALQEKMILDYDFLPLPLNE
jgi:arylsulfatase A-like enzyme